MKIYENEIQVAEREDMSYSIHRNERTGVYSAEVHYRPKNFGWDTFSVGSAKGYKTERGALNAIKRHAAKSRMWAPNGATLVF